MKKIVFALLLLLFSNLSILFAQGLQPGECGIRFTYDATGSLIQREFICNNTGGVIYRQGRDSSGKKDSANAIQPGISYLDNTAKEEVVRVSALMPNPTSGKFTVRLAKPLKNEKVLLIDANGKVIESGRQSGSHLNFDIGSFPSGIYFVKIESGGKMISLKIIRE